MAFNWKRAQKDAHRLISKYGAQAVLRRSGVDRTCMAANMDDISQGDNREFADTGTQLYVVSPLDTDGKTSITAPEFEKDSLVFNGKALRIAKKVTSLAPAGIPVYYEVSISG